jgi:hypothetical protein
LALAWFKQVDKRVVDIPSGDGLVVAPDEVNYPARRLALVDGGELAAVGKSVGALGPAHRAGTHSERSSDVSADVSGVSRLRHRHRS